MTEEEHRYQICYQSEKNADLHIDQGLQQTTLARAPLIFAPLEQATRVGTTQHAQRPNNVVFSPRGGQKSTFWFQKGHLVLAFVFGVRCYFLAQQSNSS